MSRKRISRQAGFLRVIKTLFLAVVKPVSRTAEKAFNQDVLFCRTSDDLFACCGLHTIFVSPNGRSYTPKPIFKALSNFVNSD